MENLLVATIVTPLLGVVLLALTHRAGTSTARCVALVVTLITLAMAVVLIASFLQNAPDGSDYATISRAWLPESTGIDIRWHLSMDGVSLWLFGLSALLMVSCVLVSWEAIDDRAALFYGMLLLLETGCLGVFTARDVILFYIFFEFTLIPLFFLIGIWGSEQRRYAAVKFFIFTLAGSLLTFLGLLAIVFWCSDQVDTGRISFSIGEITGTLEQHPMPTNLQVWVFLALFAGFAIKVPLFPFHTWLPLAHVQAPTAGSVILAGILLKIGTYGFLRFSIPMLPEATSVCLPWILWLSVIGIVYGALVALAQTDIKRLVAYSSVSHLGFCMLGLFALNRLGTQGAVLQMVNHGLSTGALFALIGMIYERYHTREIAKLSGLARPLPVLAFFMLLFTFSSIGLPGLNGFAGEILIFLGIFQRSWAAAPPEISSQLRALSVLALTGVVLGAWYMLWLVLRTFFGKLKTPDTDTKVRDLNLREILALAPLAVFVVWIGVCPQFFLRPVQQPVQRLTQSAERIVSGKRNDGDKFVGGDAQAGRSRDVKPPAQQVTVSNHAGQVSTFKAAPKVLCTRESQLLLVPCTKHSNTLMRKSRGT